MFAIKRNQVVITALVIMIAVAGYLNYIETTKPNDKDSLTYSEYEDAKAGKIVVDDVTGQEVMIVDSNNTNGLSQAVLNPADEEIGIALTFDDNNANQNAITLEDVTSRTVNMQTDPSAATKSDDSGGAVFVNNTSDSSFFVQAKLDREQNRAKQKETLTELINNQNVAKAQKAECANSMLEIQQRIEKETAAEALIEAKGFAEAYVRIDDNTVDVIVSKSVLSEAEIAQIEDIVKRKTGIDSANIRVAPLKAN